MIANNQTFLFCFTSTNLQYIVQPAEIAQLVREHGSIVYIKVLDPSTQAFIETSKSAVANACLFWTDACIELAKQGYRRD